MAEALTDKAGINWVKLVTGEDVVAMGIWDRLQVVGILAMICFVDLILVG